MMLMPMQQSHPVVMYKRSLAAIGFDALSSCSFVARSIGLRGLTAHVGSLAEG